MASGLKILGNLPISQPKPKSSLQSFYLARLDLRICQDEVPCWEFFLNFHKASQVEGSGIFVKNVWPYDWRWLPHLSSASLLKNQQKGFRMNNVVQGHSHQCY